MRASALLSLVLHLILLESMHHFKYGVDCFTTILLFYCTLLPLGQSYSMDNAYFKRFISVFSTNSFHPNVGLRILQIHLCIAYFFSGFEKLLGFNWRNGESVWKAIHNWNGILPVEIWDKWASTPLFLGLGWATLLLELLYPLMMNVKRIRWIWLFSVICMHLSIILVLGLFHFSAIMIVFNLVAYGFLYFKVAKQPVTV
jgi:hypothetical protein